MLHDEFSSDVQRLIDAIADIRDQREFLQMAMEQLKPKEGRPLQEEERAFLLIEAFTERLDASLGFVWDVMPRVEDQLKQPLSSRQVQNGKTHVLN